jgi:hypothetical protein
METERTPGTLPIGTVGVVSRHREEMARASAMRSSSDSGPPTLRVSHWRCGQTRTLRLPLLRTSGTDQRPTGFFLEVRIVCGAEEQSFVLDVKADFGASVPRTAELVVVKDEDEPSLPLELVSDERSREQCVPLLTAGTQSVRFHVLTDGRADVPPRMTAEIRLRASVSSPPSP